MIALAAAVSVNRGTYSASIYDASREVAAAALLREGRLALPVPLHLCGQMVCGVLAGSQCVFLINGRMET